MGALRKRPDSPGGGLRLPSTEDGLFRFVPLKGFSACAGVTLGGALYDSAPDPRKITVELHVNWGHASARQLKRVLADTEAGNSHLVNHVDEVLERRGTCRASDKAPHLPIALANQPFAPMPPGGHPVPSAEVRVRDMI